MAKDETESSPLGRSWKIWGGILALILVAIIVSFFIPANDDEPTSQGSEPTSNGTLNPGPTPSATAQDNGQCPELSTDTSMPTEAPETEWKRHPIGMVVPTSEDHGPAIQDDGFWGCYSRTPTGALYAGLGMLSNVSAGHAEATTDSPGRDEFLETHEVGDSNELPTVEDFRIIMADDSHAVVEYTLQDSQANAYIQVQLVWSEEAQDWRLDLESPGEAVTGGQINDPSAYISWR